MKRCYETIIEFKIILPNKEFVMIFDTSWKYSDMLSWMLDTFSISADDVLEIHNTFIKKFKLVKS